MADPRSDQGWTQYQKLVLAELERHDERQSALEKELIDLKLSQAKLTLELSNLVNAIKDLAMDFKDSIKDAKEVAKEATEHRIDIRELKMKFGWICAGIGLISGAGGSSLLEFIMNLFGH